MIAGKASKASLNVIFVPSDVLTKVSPLRLGGGLFPPVPIMYHKEDD